MATKLHLGINLAFAKKRWPQPREWLWVVNKIGVKYVEFCSDLLDPLMISEPTRTEIAKKTLKECKEDGVVIYDYYTGTITHCVNLLGDARPGVRKDGEHWCKEAIEVAVAMGASGMGGHLDNIPYRNLMRPREKDFLMQCVYKSFMMLAEECRKKGLKFLMLEQMYVPSEKPYTLDEAQEYYDKFNKDSAVPVYLTVDVGHACCHNFPHSDKDTDPYEWLRRFAKVSPVIHLQQTNAKESHHWPFTKIHNQLGIINPDKVIEAIEASGSKENYLMLEIFHPLSASEKQIISDLAESVQYWRKYVSD